MKPSRPRQSSIRALKFNARKGNVYSLYQLYENYLNGTHVDKDIEQANQYLTKALQIFKQQKLQINHLKITNFRAIKSLDLRQFDDHLTVIIGNNGAGKTTVLDALAMSASWLHNRIVKNGGKGGTIEEPDITIGSENDYSSIITRFKLNKKLYTEMELTKAHDGSEANKKNVIQDITKIGLLYKQANGLDGGFNLPLLAYYTVSRSLDVGVKDMAEYEDNTGITGFNKFDGYTNALNGKADFKGFFRWFKRIDDIDKHRSVNTSIPAELDKEVINKLKEMAQTDDEAEKLLQRLMSTSPDDSKKTSKDDIAGIKAILNKVVGHFMAGYGNLEVQVEPHLALTIEKNQQKLNVLQLSQGEKSMLALVLDITRRLISLNPSLPNPLDGNGVVLIDEFDLHLHPVWQRTIIRGLPQLFKNCQFIVTTHSPQILGEVKHHQVIILQQDNNNDIAHFRPKQSWGLTSNDILNELMLTDGAEDQLIRTPLVEQQLTQIYQLIEDENFDLARSQIELLEKALNGEIPELVSAKLDIELAGWDD